MLNTVFEWLSHSLESAPSIAVTASFIWGILSILLSPCHLGSIPLIVGFIDSEGRVSVRRAFWLALLFSTGILITIALIGVITSLMGRMLGDIGKYGNYIVAPIFIIVGLYLLEVIDFNFPGLSGRPGFKKKGLLAAFMLGLVFGIALGPCTFAYMAPMLGIALTTASKNFLLSVLLVTAYAAGHCSIIVLAGTFTGLVQQYLDWNEKSRGAVILKKSCGVLVILGGIYLIFSR